jgi:hypothetical protein
MKLKWLLGLLVAALVIAGIGFYFVGKSSRASTDPAEANSNAIRNFNDPLVGR